MTELFTDYEAQIAAHQKKIEELKEQQTELDRKRKGIEEFNQAVSKICETYQLEEWELFLSRGEQLPKWLKKFVKVDQPPKFLDSISKLFSGDDDGKKKGKSGKARVAAKPRKKGRKDPKLATGLYVNPHNGEEVRKIKRAPKALLDWCTEHGVTTVRGWRADD